MSQGLQLSILLTGNDTALKADSTALDAETAEQGLVFKEMLGDMVQPAKKGLGQSVLRQLPAGISMLSGVSQAMLANTEAAENTAEATSERDITLLAASLLGQIALKDQAASASADATVVADADQLADAGQAVLTGHSEVVNANVSANPLDTAKAALTHAAVQQSTVAQHDGSAADKQQSDQGQTIAVSTLKQQLQQAKADIAAQATDSKTPQNAQQNNLVNTAGRAAGQDDSSNVIAADGKVDDDADGRTAKMPAAGVAPGSQSPLSAPQAGTELISNSINADQQLRQDSAVAKTTVQHDTANDSSRAQQAAAKSEQVALNALAASQDSAELTNVPAQQAAHSHDKALTTAAEAKTAASSLQQAEKAPSSTTTETGSAMTKQGSAEQQAQQQHQRQNSASVALADAQQLLSDAHAATGKSGSEGGGANRADALFANTLHSAEVQQRQSVPGAAKTAAEQLKQSLNLQHQDAAGQLRERVNLMVRQNIQVAEIRLDPAGLGQMQIKIDMQQEQASVQFVVQQPQAKELLEQQLPRLRELLQQQGIVLSEGSVQQQSQQQERQLAQRQSDGEAGGGRHGQGTDQANSAETPDTVQVVTRLSERLVDYYA